MKNLNYQPKIETTTLKKIKMGIEAIPKLKIVVELVQEASGTYIASPRWSLPDIQNETIISARSRLRIPEDDLMKNMNKVQVVDKKKSPFLSEIKKKYSLS